MQGAGAGAGRRAERGVLRVYCLQTLVLGCQGGLVLQILSVHQQGEMMNRGRRQFNREGCEQREILVGENKIQKIVVNFIIIIK
jgi:hypothetical protein